MPAAMRFRLQLFGSPSLAGEDGTPLAGRAAQRHRLALLALLALSGGRGARRDKLQALLWPESDTEHARPLLNQAVYSLRKALGEEAILSIGEELRFNAQVVSCDVLAFEEALAAGDPERAVGLYGGPVLDGLFLTDAPEFEHWLDGERARLAQAQAKALELLAETAEGQGAFANAAEWWKARAVHDPYDSRVALRLMLALSASGNRAGAIQHAAIHQRLLQQEFDTGPDPQVLALAERLRTEPAGGMEPQPNLLRTLPPSLPSPASPPPTSPAPERQVRPVDAQVASPAPLGQRGRYRLAALGAGLFVVLAVWLGSRAAEVPLPAGIASIAILPLENLSPDPQDSMLADGMTDALIAMLARSGDVRVTASTSVFALRDQPVDVRRLADTLKVEHLLAGSFQRLGSRLRVRVRLLDARDASTRWSESYDREFVDILAVQDEIARAVAAELNFQLSGTVARAAVPAPTRNVAAYELYLRGTDRTLLRSDSTARLGMEYLHQAIALDSGFAAAWAGLGRMYTRVSMSVPPDERDQYLARATEAVARALALDDGLAEAHGTLGVLRMHDFDFTAAERHLRRAAALDPSSALVHEWLVSLHLWLARPGEALHHAERALELDPLSPNAHAEMARALIGSGRCDEALAKLGELASLRPPLLRVAPMTAECLARKGMYLEAMEAMRPQMAQTGRPGEGMYGYLAARAGQREVATGMRDTLVRRWRQGGGRAFDVALVSAGLGHLDDAFAWVDSALVDRSLIGAPGGPAVFILTGPLLEDLRQDARFEGLRTRLGLPRQ